MQFCGTADALVRAQWTLSTLRLKPLDVQVLLPSATSGLHSALAGVLAGGTEHIDRRSRDNAAAAMGEPPLGSSRHWRSRAQPRALPVSDLFHHTAIDTAAPHREAVDALVAKLLIREHPGSALMLALCAFDCTPELWDGDQQALNPFLNPFHCRPLGWDGVVMPVDGGISTGRNGTVPATHAVNDAA